MIWLSWMSVPWIRVVTSSSTVQKRFEIRNKNSQYPCILSLFLSWSCFLGFDCPRKDGYQYCICVCYEGWQICLQIWNSVLSWTFIKTNINSLGEHDGQRWAGKYLLRSQLLCKVHHLTFFCCLYLWLLLIEYSFPLVIANFCFKTEY